MSQRGELITKKKDKLKMVVDISRCCGSVGIVDASDGEIRGSNPVFGEIYAKHVFTVNCCKDENKEKEFENCRFIKRFPTGDTSIAQK